MPVLHTIVSHVRGGGVVGNGAWVARIIGPDEKYGLARKFLRKNDHRSGSGRSGCLSWEIEQPGCYEYRGVGSTGQSIARQSRNGGGDAGFLIIEADGSVTEATKDEVLERISAQGRE